MADIVPPIEESRLDQPNMNQDQRSGNSESPRCSLDSGYRSSRGNVSPPQKEHKLDVYPEKGVQEGVPPLSPSPRSPSYSSTNDDELKARLIENQSVLVLAKDGDRILGCWPLALAPSELGNGLKSIGDDIMRSLQRQDFDVKERELTPDMSDDESDADVATDIRISDEIRRNDANSAPPSWDLMRESIPPFVKGISFKIDDDALTGHFEDLQKRFPDVIFQRLSATECKETQTEVTTRSQASQTEPSNESRGTQTESYSHSKETQTAVVTNSQGSQAQPSNQSPRTETERIQETKGVQARASSNATKTGTKGAFQASKSIQIPDLKPTERERLETALREAEGIAQRVRKRNPFFPGLQIPENEAAMAEAVWASKGTDRAIYLIEKYGQWAVKECPWLSQGQSPKSKPEACSSVEKPISGPSDSQQSSSPILMGLAKDHKIRFSNIEHLEETYEQWKKEGVVKKVAPRKYKLDAYYLNLVDLYIVGHHIQDAALMQSVLVAYQSANFQWNGDVPPLEAPVKAFRHLPTESDLCQWNTWFYGYLWTTRVTGDYWSMRYSLRDYDDEEIGAFLFGVALVRCSHVRNGDVTLLQAWCKFHNHTDRHEKILCQQIRDNILQMKGTSLEGQKGELELTELQKAQELIEKHGGEVTYPSRSKKRKVMLQSPPTQKKRKTA